MSKNKNKKNEEQFEDIFTKAEFNDKFEDEDEDGLFDDQNFEQYGDEAEDYENEQYGDEQQLPATSTEQRSGVMSTIGNIANIAKENKLATVGVLGVVGFGLWKAFGSKEEGSQNSSQQAKHPVPPSYDDEFLELDEEDSVDEFIDQNNSNRINPMFTPLRFK
jgi:hypothetical protein